VLLWCLCGRSDSSCWIQFLHIVRVFVASRQFLWLWILWLDFSWQWGKHQLTLQVPKVVDLAWSCQVRFPSHFSSLPWQSLTLLIQHCCHRGLSGADMCRHWLHWWVSCWKTFPDLGTLFARWKARQWSARFKSELECSEILWFAIFPYICTIGKQLKQLKSSKWNRQDPSRTSKSIDRYWTTMHVLHHVTSFHCIALIRLLSSEVRRWNSLSGCEKALQLLCNQKFQCDFLDFLIIT
jgi:hypothetical protein